MKTFMYLVVVQMQHKTDGTTISRNYEIRNCENPAQAKVAAVAEAASDYANYHKFKVTSCQKDI